MPVAAPEVPPRFLPLEGGLNLRDMGGYATEGGGRVKHGMLYRSGAMALLTRADETFLRTLGIHTVCDFRRADERETSPTRWHEGTDTAYWTRDYEHSSGILGQLLADDGTTPEAMRDAILGIYPSLAYDHLPSFQALFDRLLAGDVPLLFNCSAGKDRTGVAGVLILHALGVDAETIRADYLLTNDADFSISYRSNPRSRLATLARTRPEIIAPLMAADPAYLDAMYAGMDARSGGIDGFLTTELGIDASARVRLRELLVD